MCKVPRDVGFLVRKGNETFKSYILHVLITL